MDKSSNDFIRALENNDQKGIQAVPKSDLHNHSTLGSPFNKLLDWYGKPLPEPPPKFKGIVGMNAYLRDALQPVILTRAGMEYAYRAAFRQAVDDGITVLEMSVDLWFLRLFKGNAKDFTAYLKQTAEQFAGNLHFIPQLGFDRHVEVKRAFPEIMALLDTGYFRSIDLYGEELAREPRAYKEIFRQAKQAGLRLKAHAGEFGDAESVRHTVEMLGLDEVQHGISAAKSQEVMRWLHEYGAQLNTCPSSNIALGIVANMKEHPIRALVDSGIKITINTDDMMLFGQSVSDEYLNLFKAGTLTARELDKIRLTGLGWKEA